VKDAAGLSGRKVVLGKRAFFLEDEIEDVDGAADVVFALLVDGPHPRMARIVDPVDFQSFDPLVGLVNIADLNDRDRALLVI